VIADDLALLRTPGRPALSPDGTVLVAVWNADLDKDRYGGTLLQLAPGTAAREFTRGPRDSAPILSPDGHTLIFLRADEAGPAQLQVVDLLGGEPRPLTAHPLGAGAVVFAPAGDRIGYLSPVVEPGRYGTDPDVTPEAEPPRPIDRMSYRRDGKGFVLDKPEQVFVRSLAPDAEPVALTDEPDVVSGPAFRSDGRAVYARTSEPDRPQCELVLAPDEHGEVPAAGTLITKLSGNAVQVVAFGDTIYFLGAEFEDFDFAGRTTGLWSVRSDGTALRRLTGADVEVDGTAPPVVVGSVVLVSVLDRGSVSLRAVPQDAERAALAALTSVIGGGRVVTSFTANQDGDGNITVAAVVADTASPGEVVTVRITSDGTPAQPEEPRTELAAPLRAAGLALHQEITAIAPDGYPVHGFLVLPDSPGPHPVLLVVHGGPHNAYGWGLFDEAQIYAGAGYAVLLPNPRGSAGYGHEHGRTVLHRLGTVDADDVLALLDAALERPDCDRGRVGVMGGSYGGFLTSWLAAKAPERFTAAISERAVNAWDSFAGSSDIGYYFAESYTGADRDSQWRFSPLAYADDIRLPLLIIHSEHDWRCPVEQAQRLFVALKRRGAEVEMLLFPGEGHELSRSGRPRHRLQRFSAILAWWARHLPVGPAG